ncbi:hypothetical protein LCGC14_1912360, partial [marine sediment metagenome]
SQGGACRVHHCERRFMFQDKWGLHPKTRPYSRGMKVGSIIHLFLKYGIDGQEKVQKAVYESHQKLLDRIKKGEDLAGDLAREANDLNSAYETAKVVVIIYWEKFPVKNYVETLSREKELKGFLDVGGMMLPVIAILDWVVKDKRDGGVWIRDTKSTGRGVDAILVGYSYSFQSRFYRTAVDNWTEWAGDLRGFILDIVKTPAIKCCGKDEKQAAKVGCTPAEAYLQRVKEWYTENERGGDSYMTSRALPFVDPLYPAEFSRSLLKIASVWSRPLDDPENFDRDQTKASCFSFERRCPYYDLCMSAPISWPSQIEAEFQFVKPDEKRTEL